MQRKCGIKITFVWLDEQLKQPKGFSFLFVLQFMTFWH